MAMSLIQGIHRRWASSGPLCALLPASRVSTGLSADPAVPRAVIRKESDRPLAACNDGSTVASVGVRIEVFHGDYDAAAAIVDQINAAMDRVDFALDDGDKVIDMRRTNGSEQQQDDGLWRMVVDFTCAVQMAARTGEPA